MGDSDSGDESNQTSNQADLLRHNDVLHSDNSASSVPNYNNIAIQPDAQELGINLDEQPTSEHVITSVLKDRPKIPQKRKLPSKVSQSRASDSASKDGMPNGVITNQPLINSESADESKGSKKKYIGDNDSTQPDQEPDKNERLQKEKKEKQE